jgi:hypothetical protein
MLRGAVRHKKTSDCGGILRHREVLLTAKSRSSVLPYPLGDMTCRTTRDFPGGEQ